MSRNLFMTNIQSNHDSQSSTKKILLIGIDPRHLSQVKLPDGVTPELIKAEAIQANQALKQLGYEVHNCSTDLGETATFVVADLLAQHLYECIMIGAGIRTVNEHLILFENLINLIHHNAPNSAICFNTRPADSVAAILRHTGNR